MVCHRNRGRFPCRVPRRDGKEEVHDHGYVGCVAGGRGETGSSLLYSYSVVPLARGPKRGGRRRRQRFGYITNHPMADDEPDVESRAVGGPPSATLESRCLGHPRLRREMAD